MNKKGSPTGKKNFPTDRITSCRVCGSKKINEFLDLGKQPYANSLLKVPDEKEKFYPLSLSFCFDCSLVQLNHTADPDVLFSNYVWVTATSETARSHAEIFCKEMLSRFDKPVDGYILEIASNDGTFLLPFIKKGYKVLGIDPANNIADLANAQGIETLPEFFGVASAKKILKKYGPAKALIARNVVPHVAALHDFLEGLSICLDKDGLLAIEFHYAKKINDSLHYDSIYHEHLCYFTLKSLEKLLHQYNFFIQDLTTSPISGGSLVVYAKKGRVKERTIVSTYRKAEEETKLNEFQTWEKFANRVSEHRKKLIKILKKFEGSKIVGYGASARSSTLLNYCNIDTKIVSAIADQNPLKHKYFTAGTHILIDNPDIIFQKKSDAVIILAWNFTKEITKILREKYNYSGKLIIPLPNNPKVKQA